MKALKLVAACAALVAAPAFAADDTKAVDKKVAQVTPPVETKKSATDQAGAMQILVTGSRGQYEMPADHPLPPAAAGPNNNTSKKK